MADFHRYIPKLKKFEGGWVDDPDDKGGATMCGVTLNTYRLYFGISKTKEDLRSISDTEWAFIMKKYWDKCKGDQIINQDIAEIFVDWHINSGASAIRKVQTVFGLKSDGIVGKQTLSKLNQEDAETTFNRIKSARESFYRKLAITTPSNQKFLKGWLRRCQSFTFNK